jgi:hypothetical protein
MCFVLAFTLAIMLSPDTSLGQALAAFDAGWPASLQHLVRDDVSDWVWRQLVLPVLQRPVWLLPTGFGLVSAGAAVTMATRRGATRSHRRRS